ncbi:hypothetical protein SVIOM342S_10033 [Streptomyces violaceorubidus]
MAVASGSSPEAIAAILARTGLDAHLGTVVSADEVAPGKPAPDVFLQTTPWDVRAGTRGSFRAGTPPGYRAWSGATTRSIPLTACVAPEHPDHEARDRGEEAGCVPRSHTRRVPGGRRHARRAERAPADPPAWPASRGATGPHPRPVVAAKLGVSIAGLHRGRITQPLTTEQIEALKGAKSSSWGEVVGGSGQGEGAGQGGHVSRPGRREDAGAAGTRRCRTGGHGGAGGWRLDRPLYRTRTARTRRARRRPALRSRDEEAGRHRRGRRVGAGRASGAGPPDAGAVLAVRRGAGAGRGLRRHGHVPGGRAGVPDHRGPRRAVPGPVRRARSEARQPRTPAASGYTAADRRADRALHGRGAPTTPPRPGRAAGR